MIRKIISGGRAGVENAALDVALALHIDCGGWMAEDADAAAFQTLKQKYHLEMAENGGDGSADDRNLAEADGILILTRGGLDSRLDALQSGAQKDARPRLHLDFNKEIAFEAAQEIASWVESYDIQKLFVTGGGAEQDPLIYKKTLDVLETAIYMTFIEGGLKKTTAPHGEDNQPLPESLEDAVNRLLTKMPLKDRALMANMTEDEVESLQSTLGEYIRNTFDLWSDNEALYHSCRFVAGKRRLDAYGATLVILKALWRRLKETHKLRRVK